MTLTADRLRELFDYDQTTGIFVRRIGVRGGLAGEIAGYVHSTLGYRYIGVDRKVRLAHRLAWLYTTGCWPGNTIDHINGDRSDNRISNLRDVPHRVNCENRKAPKADTASGILGVFRNRERWVAKIRIQGKQTNLGTYATREEASVAYLAAKRQFHKGNTL